MSHGRQPEVEFFLFGSVLTPSRLQRQTTNFQQELFPSVVRSKNAPKKETFDFPLPSVAHERQSVFKLPNRASSDTSFYYSIFKENDKTFKFAIHVSTDTSVIFSYLKGRVHGSVHVLESKYFLAFACYDPSLFNLIRCL